MPYRTEEEVAEWMLRDPLTLHRDRLVEQGIATADELAELDQQDRAAIEEALEFARESPYPEPDEVFDDLYTNPIPIDRY